MLPLAAVGSQNYVAATKTTCLPPAGQKPELINFILSSKQLPAQIPPNLYERLFFFFLAYGTQLG